MSNGEPILVKHCKVPEVMASDPSELPILGLPLVNFQDESEKPVGRAMGRKLWNILISSILHGRNDNTPSQADPEEVNEPLVNAKDILLVNMLDALEQMQDSEEYIQKAFTCGVKIKNHGFDAKFK